MQSSSALNSGNRCGHVPDQPVLDALVDLPKKAPPILRDALKKVREFYAHPMILPFLNHEQRQRRSEAREAFVVVLTVLLKHLDLVTMKIIMVTPQGERQNVDLRYLHSQSGLSFSRFKRAWLALIDAGIIKSFKQHEKTEEGDYKGLPSIKTITPLLFSAMNLGKRLKAARDYLSEQFLLRKAKKMPMARAIDQIREKANSQRFKKNLKKASGLSFKPKQSNSNNPPPAPPPLPPMPEEDRRAEMLAQFNNLYA